MGRSQQAGRVEQVGRSQQADRVEQVGRSQQADRVEQVGRSQQADRVEQMGRSQQADRVEQVGGAQQADRVEQVGRSQQADRVEQVGRAQQADRVEQMGRSQQADRVEQVGRSHGENGVEVIRMADRAGRVEQTGVLILHGFGGGPGEVKALGAHLQKLGFIVSVPLLPGHGHGKYEMKQFTRKQWAAAVEMAYGKLVMQCGKVYIAGFSMGGLLAVRLLAAEFPGKNRQNESLGGLITVNTPVYYWNIRQVIKNLVQKKNAAETGLTVEAATKSVARAGVEARERAEAGTRTRTGTRAGMEAGVDAGAYTGLIRSGGLSELRRYLSCASGLPICAMIQFQLLLSETKRLYGRLFCPALIIQIQDDDAVWPVSGDHMLRRMKGERALVKFPSGGHQVFNSDQAEAVCRLIGDFIGGRQTQNVRLFR